MFYQPSDDYCCFVFIVCNNQSKKLLEKEKQNAAMEAKDTNKKAKSSNQVVSSENKVMKKSYIFVRKDREEMEQIFRAGSEGSAFDIL